MGKLTISMAIFNSYVKLPEGIPCINIEYHFYDQWVEHPRKKQIGLSIVHIYGMQHGTRKKTWKHRYNKNFHGSFINRKYAKTTKFAQALSAWFQSTPHVPRLDVAEWPGSVGPTPRCGPFDLTRHWPTAFRCGKRPPQGPQLRVPNKFLAEISVLNILNGENHWNMYVYVCVRGIIWQRTKTRINWGNIVYKVCSPAWNAQELWPCLCWVCLIPIDRWLA